MSAMLNMYIPKSNMQSLICITAIWTFASQLNGLCEKYFWKTQHCTFAKWQSKSCLIHLNLFQNKQCQGTDLGLLTHDYMIYSSKYSILFFS